MRLISQSGRLDFPYEQVVLQQDECWIYARLVCESKARNLLGEYSTPERQKRSWINCMMCMEGWKDKK